MECMFVADSRFSCCFNIKELKGNTGVKSGAVPATVIPPRPVGDQLLFCNTIVRQLANEKVNKSRESQETCRHLHKLKAFGRKAVM